MRESNEKLTPEKLTMPSAEAYLREMLQEYIDNCGLAEQGITPEELIDENVINGIHAVMRSFARIVSRMRMLPLEQEIGHLRAWKKEAIELYEPLVKYGQSKESGLKVGQSITDHALKALMEVKSLRREIEIERHKAKVYGQRIAQMNTEKETLKAERDQLEKNYNELIQEDEVAICIAFMRITAGKLESERRIKLLKVMGKVASSIEAAETIIKIASKFPSGGKNHPNPRTSWGGWNGELPPMPTKPDQ